MDLGRRAFIAGSVVAAAAVSSAAQGQWGDPPSPAAGDPKAPFWPPGERFGLWPGKPPGAPARPITPNWTMNGPAATRELWIRGVPFPEVHVFRPARPDGSAMLALPGGGYGFLSVQNEGLDVAQHFTAGGTTVFVLTYRLPGEGWADRSVVPLQDAQRAMRLIRSRAATFRIDPARLGVVGFSAGGHLAADLAVSHDEQVYRRIDAADGLSARPAYLGLVYPVTTLVDAGANSRSMDVLLGPGATLAQQQARSPLLRVTKSAPPSFLVHAMDDGTVPEWHSLRWVDAVGALGLPVESHVFSEGGHGFGLHLARDLPGSRWPELFGLWLRKHGG